MNITTNDISETRKAVTVSVPRATISEEEKGILATFAKEAKIPGFRPGKAPVTMIKARYKKEVSEELKRRVYSKAYEQITKSEDIKVYNVVDMEEVEITGGADVALEFKVDIEPVFELPQYKELALKGESDEVDDEEIDGALDQIRGQRAEFDPVERAVEATDYVKLNYEGKVDGTPIEEIAPDAKMYGTQKNTWEEAGADSSMGNGVPAIVDALIGMAAGDKKTVEQVYEDDFSVEELKGKTAQYEIEIVEVRQKKLPEINEDFLKEFEVETEEELREKIGGELKNRKNAEVQAKLKKQVMEHLEGSIDFAVPQSAVDMESQHLLRSHIQEQMQKGITPEQFEENRETLLESSKVAAEKQVKNHFVLLKIAEKEEIKVENKDMQERIMQEAMMTRRSPDEIVKVLQKDQSKIAELQRAVLINKTLDFLVESATVSA